MRKQIVAGNWKMNTSVAEGKELATGVMALVNTVQNAEVIIAPPATHLTEIAKLTKGSAVKLAAQNCSQAASGAYTGEISPKTLAEIGVEYVILGHSERRTYFNETGSLLNEKVKAVLNFNLKPIFCVGERLEERESGQEKEVVQSQLAVGLFNLSEADFAKVVIAYEPVWAIGTGKTATSAQAQEMHQFIRSVIAMRYSKTIADKTTILYGGSCKASNARELFAAPDIDGGLIGGASLVADEFINICKSF